MSVTPGMYHFRYVYRELFALTTTHMPMYCIIHCRTADVTTSTEILQPVPLGKPTCPLYNTLSAALN